MRKIRFKELKMPRATKVVKVRILNPDFLGLKPVFSRICTVKTEYKLRNAELNPCLKTSSLPHQSDITILLFFYVKIRSQVILWGF